jgi:hypothetical protein
MTQRYSTSILPASTRISGNKIIRKEVNNMSPSHPKTRYAVAQQAAVDTVAAAVHSGSCQDIDSKNA